MADYDLCFAVLSETLIPIFIYCDKLTASKQFSTADIARIFVEGTARAIVASDDEMSAFSTVVAICHVITFQDTVDLYDLRDWLYMQSLHALFLLFVDIAVLTRDIGDAWTYLNERWQAYNGA